MAASTSPTPQVDIAGAPYSTDGVTTRVRNTCGSNSLSVSSVTNTTGDGACDSDLCARLADVRADSTGEN